MITKHLLEPIALKHDGLFHFSELVDDFRLAVIEGITWTKQIGLGVVKRLV
ncbi:hypothetical protein [Peribacillus phoenicis]|uniref:hypothetical protein n=1 Tax=unclassified Peribacillus TaxID=2675266 RepID=UPI00399FDE16